MSAEFELLTDGLGVGRPPAGWVAIVDMPVLILVGVTGVGKSTTVDALRNRIGGISLLPNRRKLADLLVIPTVQGWDGDPPAAVTDRRRRFDYTGRYRQRYPGGLAHAFSRLMLQKQAAASGSGALNVFDGLRGADEVTFAAQSLPLARFAVLHAPDVVRVERLVQRQDAFDQVGENTAGRFCWEEMAAARDLFTREEQDHLSALVCRGEVNGAELAARIAIVAAERRNYDPHAAVEILRAAAPDRTVVVDTTSHAPAEVAAKLERLAAS
ncbi:MAG: ATPase [Caldilineaceae bacterium SB0675_bin_29]|uniref:ATPase n=1 Tax=Caldilineaceae bacterium SB0675_bin_29 TaxID=2605266 RepID=A0A6B1G5E3_9CHLR|nr:ATPase [Caldilineaceae bacterium SB0675_bin_29]